MRNRIAIIGAGIAGLTLAHRLSIYGDVCVFEKARGVGGRMSTRYAAPFTFDHGAQYFTVRNDRFAEYIHPYLTSGLIQEWKGKVITLEPGKKITDRLWFEPHFVACPGMNSLCKMLAQNLNIYLNSEITPLKGKKTDGYELLGINGESFGAYDLVVSTAPPLQTSQLFDAFLPKNAKLRQTKFLACFTLMLGFRKKWDKSWIAAKIQNSPLEWLSVNSTKPGRNHDLTTLVVHSNNHWAQEHVNDSLQQVELFLQDQLKQVVKFNLGKPDYLAIHRWLYALLDKPADDKSLEAPYYDQTLQLACVGDWGSQSRIESTWLAANQLADQILFR